MINASSVKRIKDYAFQNCSSLTCIEIPSSCKLIGDFAFKNCSSLKQIEIPSSCKLIRNGSFKKSFQYSKKSKSFNSNYYVFI